MILQAACPHCGAANRIPPGREAADGRCGKCGLSLGLSSVIEADDVSLRRHLDKTKGLLILDVWAPWCGPCQLMAPHFERAAAQLGRQARFLKLNSDTSSLASELGVRSIPSLILFQNGREIARRAGLTPFDQLSGWILSHSGVGGAAGAA